VTARSQIFAARELWQDGRVNPLDRWRIGWRCERSRARAAASWGRRLLTIAVGVVGLGLTPAARGAELSVRGPESCPDAEEIAFRVERMLGVPFARSVPLRFGVTFEPPPAPPARYTARLEVLDRAAHHQHATRQAGAQRVLRARDCARLGDAVSVAIALAIGAEATPPATPAEPAMSEPATLRRAAATSPLANGSTPPADGAPADRDRAASSEASGERHALAPVLAAFLLADSGSLPSPGLGAGLGLELRARRVALRAQGVLLFDQHVALEPRAGAPGADMSLALASLSACLAPLGSFRSGSALFACAGWELGRLGAEGTGVQTPRRGEQLWTAPRLDAGLSWAVPGSVLRVGLQLTVTAPLKRDDFFLRELGNVHRAPGAVGRLAAGVELALW
jgi:hypothetical protein